LFESVTDFWRSGMPGRVEKRLLIFCWKAEFSVYARRLFVAGDVSRMVSTIYVDWRLDEGSRHRLERAYFR